MPTSQAASSFPAQPAIDITRRPGHGAHRPGHGARRLAALGGVALTLVGTALSGCGGSSGPTSKETDPATLTPASAKLFASIAIEPAGQASVAVKRLTRQAEPYASIAQALLGSGSHLQYRSDVKPWIGRDAGVFVNSIGAKALSSATSASAQGLLETLLSGGVSSLAASAFGPGGVEGAVVLDVSDLKGAQSFVSKRAREQGAHSSNYRGMSFEVSSSGSAEAIVHGLVVIGSESGVKSAIDTSISRASIATAPGYSPAPKNAIANVYLKPEELNRALPKSGASEGVALLGKLFAGASSASVAVTGTNSSLQLEGHIHSARASATPLFGPQGAEALGEFPGGSWLAAGVGDTGSNLSHALGLLQTVASLGSSTVFASIGGESIEKIFQLLDSSSAKLQQDFGSWAGPGGIFVSGTGLFNLESALVLKSKDAAASSAAVGKLASLMGKAGASVSSASVPGADRAMNVRLTGFPAVLVIASGSGKFVIGLGEASAKGALSPTSTLSSSSAYANASSTLGGGIQPSLIVEFPALLGFLEGVGLSQSQAVSGFVPYFRSLGTLTAGASQHGPTQRFRLVLTLSSAESSEEATG